MCGRGAIIKISFVDSRNKHIKLPDFIPEDDEIIAKSLSAKTRNYGVKKLGEKNRPITLKTAKLPISGFLKDIKYEIN